MTANEFCAAEKLIRGAAEVETDFKPVPVLNSERVSKDFSEINGDVC